MADTITVNFTRPVRIHKKLYDPTSKPTPVDADIAADLIEIGAAIEVKPDEAKGAGGKGSGGSKG